jgi:hypothetical protein
MYTAPAVAHREAATHSLGTTELPTPIPQEFGGCEFGLWSDPCRVPVGRDIPRRLQPGGAPVPER